jgi:hypothetical protein
MQRNPLNVQNEWHVAGCQTPRPTIPATRWTYRPIAIQTIGRTVAVTAHLPRHGHGSRHRSPTARGGRVFVLSADDTLEVPGTDGSGPWPDFPLLNSDTVESDKPSAFTFSDCSSTQILSRCLAPLHPRTFAPPHLCTSAKETLQRCHPRERGNLEAKDKDDGALCGTYRPDLGRGPDGTET